jgi:hypothetical protein
MSQSRHKPEQIIANLREAEVEISRGVAVAQAVCKIGVTRRGGAARAGACTPPGRPPSPSLRAAALPDPIIR